MKLFLKKLTACGIASVAFLFIRAAEPVDVEFIAVDNGLSNNRVDAIYQDSIGFLWFATYDGLNRYDGYEFKVYREEAFNDESLSSSVVTCITGDSRGYLWIGTERGLNRFNRGLESFERISVPGYASVHFNVQDLVADKQETVWGITTGLLFRIDIITKAVTPVIHTEVFSDPEPFQSARIFLDSSGDLWVGTRNGLFLVRNGENFLRATTLNKATLSFHEDKSGQLWVGTSEGLVLIDRQSTDWKLFTPPFTGSKQVRGIVDLNDGQLHLIGRQGIMLFSVKRHTFLSVGELSFNGRVLDLPIVRRHFLDRSDILWMATRQGVIRHDFKPRIFNKYCSDETSFPRLPTDMIYALYKDSEGKIWIGTSNMGLFIMDRINGKVENYSPRGTGNMNFPLRSVYNIQEDASNRVWVTADRISIYDPETGTFSLMQKYFDIPEEQMPDLRRFYRFIELRPGYFLIGARSGLWFFDEDKRTFSTDSVLTNDSISIPVKEVAALQRDNEGNIWAGCNAGVIRFSPDMKDWKFYRRGEETGLAGNETYAILSTSAGEIWVGTTSGVARYLPDEDRFRIYTVKDGLPNDFVYAMLEDNNGNIWISTNQGLSMLDPRSETFFNYELKDGLQSLEFNLHSAYRARDNELLFGGIGGLNSFYPDSLSHMNMQPLTTITGIKFLNKVRGKEGWTSTDRKEIHFTDKHAVQISFSSLDFTSTKHNSYRYRLYKNGEDPPFITLGKENSVILSGLKYGNYRFEVLGSNSDGIWSSEPAAIEVVVTAPFYRHRIFLFSLGVFLTLFAYLFYRFRTRTLRESNRILREKEIAALEVLRQRNLLSRRNKNIEDSLMYAQRIQQAMFTTVKDVQRLFPESFVLQRPKDIVSGDFFWARKIDNMIFLAAADCTGHGVPGAFMSLIGLELFRQIITGKKLYKPGEILDELNNNFNIIFGNMEDISLKDGMDLSFCTFHTDTNVMEFAGAFNPVYLIRNREIIEVKGDRISVGPDNGFYRPPFTNQTIQLEKDDIIYMFSDGYADQFGGPEGKKFKFRRFRHLLLSVHHHPMDKQQRILEDSILDWIGDYEQVDDIMVLGVRPFNS